MSLVREIRFVLRGLKMRVLGCSVEHDTILRLQEDVVGKHEVQHMVDEYPRSLEFALHPGGTRLNGGCVLFCRFEGHGPRLCPRAGRHLGGNPAQCTRDLIP